MLATIALIAHDSQKDDLVRFVQRYERVLRRYRLIATQHTGQQLEDGTNLQVERVLAGTEGGNVQIATQVVEGKISAVIFFVAPQYLYEPDLQIFLRLCTVHQVPLAINHATAEIVIKHLAMSVAHLIFNPVAGQGNPQQQLKLIKKHLETQFHLAVHLTTPEKDAQTLTREAIKAEADVIIASGGDGTVSAVADALVNTDIPLGVIPRGTANAFSVALGIPTELEGACETILTGIRRKVDTARCNDYPMILLAGIGFEAGTVEQADREAKNRWGVLAYLMAGWQQLEEQVPFEATLEIDGVVKTFQAGAITIANVAPPTSILAQGGGEVIADDGLLDVTVGIVGSQMNKMEAIQTFADLFGAALLKTATSRDNIVHLRGKKVKVTTNPPQKVVIDGEMLEPTALEVECIPQSLIVFAPNVSQAN